MFGLLGGEVDETKDSYVGTSMIGEIDSYVGILFVGDDGV